MPAVPEPDAVGRRIPRRIAYSLFGAALALGAPAGLFFVRLAAGADEPVTYAYVLLSTMVVFALFGWRFGRQADHLIELSTTDELTGLLNARGFYQRLHQELAGARRSGQPLSLFTIDLDDLKSINDRYGHQAGDQALRLVAGALRDTLRATDVAARVGGDEFMLLAPNTSAAVGVTLARRIQTQAAESGSQLSSVSTTVSVGVATFDPELDRTIDTMALTKVADNALYDAKRRGGNCVCAARA
jgi:diguanylate cyclase (GGDEF)-like protein